MNRMQRKKLSLAVFRALSAGAAVGLAAPLAYGQAAPPVEKVQKITVTGSRIPLQTLESESPVSIISAQDIANTGLTNVADIINQLPQAFADFGQMEANGATGTATVNLRDLGSSRTLVLIDGRRLPAGDPRLWATDLNAIPAPLIQRVDVLTGGASSIYGSDAVAGVVNFIMNDHFEGVQFSWNGNAYSHNQGDSSGVSASVASRAQTNPAQFAVPGNVNLDGYTQDFSMTLGGNFAGGKGNATVYFEYKHSNPVLQNSRDFSACSIASTDTSQVCLGSSTSFPGRFQGINADGTTTGSFTIANAAGTVRPFNAATDQFNFGPYNYYQVPDERYLFDAFAHYDAFPNARVYAEFEFPWTNTVRQIAPSGIFGAGRSPLFDDNPLLSQSFKTAFGITPGQPRHRAHPAAATSRAAGATTFPVTRRLPHRDRRQGRFPGRQVGLRRLVAVRQGRLPGDLPQRLLGDAHRARPECRHRSDHRRPARCASVVDGTDPTCVPYNIFQTGRRDAGSARLPADARLPERRDRRRACSGCT